MNANTSLRDLIAQAGAEYGLEKGSSEYEQAELIVRNRYEIELAVSEEVKDFFAAKNGSGDIWLGTGDGSGGLSEQLEWEIKNQFLDRLLNRGVLKSVSNGGVIDEEGLVSIFTKKVVVNEEHEDKMQGIINELAKEVKDSGKVLLIKGDLHYDANTSTLLFGEQAIDFSNLSRHHYMLDFLFNKIEPYVFVDSDTLYEYVFEKELPMKLKNDGKNNIRNQEVKKLGNVRDEINQKVKDDFNTSSQLIFSRGSYKRRF